MAAIGSSTQRNIVILGGSYGGISIAHYVLKHVIPKLPTPETYKVILVSKASEALCRPACPRALVSDSLLPHEKIFANIPNQFLQYQSMNFQFIRGTVSDLDHTNRIVRISLADSEPVETLNFHAVVIATGASTHSPLLGLTGNEGKLKADWASFREALTFAKSIVIAGGGPSGIEVAGELGEYLNGRAGVFDSNLKAPNVPISVVTSSSKILPRLRSGIADKAERYLAEVGVSVIKGTSIKTVAPETAGTKDVTKKAVITLDNGNVLEADLYIPAFGTVPNTGFIDRSLLSTDGRVKTEPGTLRVDKAGPRIYAIGDASSWARPAVHNILDAVPVLGANLRRDLLLATALRDIVIEGDKTFKEDTREMQLVPIGTSKGVGAVMGWQLPSWLVWLMKGRDYWLWTTSSLWNGRKWSTP
ncbi:hypothetical protein JX266_006403 [Neoarthrinium moseri]|uniref:uncharacterized protein n=1 Tax=Neoarthrinium moseri TaxID=1658444 RepID=UPI001FDB253A|nr:uncharacterized protein JN550_007092 [Neoarthrinium moseri]KAI1847551.1 hypothetical protein JX266_006403 [Neoarthrinium moseri]KAI1867361.1 hypothetical protein JN550_007092 [Neoarthrinium moseri]